MSDGLYSNLEEDQGLRSEVLSRAGIPHHVVGGRRFGKFDVTLQAAMADQGVALGWDRLVRNYIADGRLVTFTDLVLPAPGAYYLTRNNNRNLSPAATVFRNWLTAAAAKERSIAAHSPSGKLDT